MSTQCDCIEKAELAIQKRIREVKPDCEIVEEPTIQNKGYVMYGNKWGTGIFSPTLGRYKQGKRILKWEPNLSYSYCPFCGEKYPQYEEEELES